MLRLLIIDDEPLARQKMRQLLVNQPGCEVTGEAASVTEALQLIEKEKPDALFLDIEMPAADGFTLLRNLENQPPVVFVTAHAEHAVRAFEMEAVDYLLKPVRPERLAKALGRLRSGPLSETPWQHKDRICFRAPERTVIVKSEAIIALEAQGDYTRIFVEGEHPVMICHPLNHYEKILPSPPFLRLDRSLMINRDRVKEIEPLDRNHETLTLSGLGTSFALGRIAHRRLAEALREEQEEAEE
jgi:two-component system LytT family response regulator